MKKIVYIGILFLALVATSCTKEEIVAGSNDSNNRPIWNNDSYAERPSAVEGENTPTEEDNSQSEDAQPVDNTPPPIDFNPIGEITDPNNDPDGKKRKP